MTVESDLFDTLKGLVSNRVYPDLAPAEAAKPYVVYQQIGGESPTFLERASPSKKNGRFQVVVWAETRAQASLVSLQIEAAMVAATVFQAKPVGDRTAVYDEDTQLRGSRQDFSVWSDR